MKFLVLNVPALHAGYLGCYGNEWIETPQLDRLAAQGVLFDQHYADSPDAAGEQRSSWTGRYHFPASGKAPDPAAKQASSLPRLLQDQGIGFAVVGGPGAGLLPGDAETTDGKETERRCLAVLEQMATREHGVVWVDWPSLAPPWEVPEDSLARYFAAGAEEEEAEPLAPWTDPPTGPLELSDDTALERLQNTYAAAVTAFDARLGALLDELEERGLGGDLLLCITSDRGLALGEHGVVGDGRPWLHEEVMHLPLLVRLPGGGEAGRRVFALTQPVDLLPTVLEALGVPLPAEVHGRSLWPLLRGEAEQVRAYACAGRDLGETAEWALRTPEWGFIRTEGGATAGPLRGPQLYVKPDDRWEVNNVLQHHLDLADHFEQVLRGFVEASRRPGPLQPPELRDVPGELAQAEGKPATEATSSGD
jgi:arylsulfatase A-like enzyme